MKPKDLLGLLLLAAIWGSSFLFIKMVVPSVGVGITMSMRVMIAAAFLVVVVCVNGQVPDLKKNGGRYLILGLLNLVLPIALIVFSVSKINASTAALLNAMTPLFTMLIARFWLNEKLGLQKISGLVLGLAGIIVLVGWNPMPLDSSVGWAILASLGAAISYGFGNVFSRIKFAGTEPMKTATGQMIVAAVFVSPILFTDTAAGMVYTDMLLLLMVLGIVCTAFAFILYFKLISRIGSVNTSMVTILVPVFGTLWSAIFLDEPVTLSLLLGLLLILGGLVFSLRPASAKAETTNPVSNVKSQIDYFTQRVALKSSSLEKRNCLEGC
jgi:drug/metabolite transporter (DMT)-like permease